MLLLFLLLAACCCCSSRTDHCPSRSAALPAAASRSPPLPSRAVRVRYCSARHKKVEFRVFFAESRSNTDLASLICRTYFGASFLLILQVRALQYVFTATSAELRCKKSQISVVIRMYSHLYRLSFGISSTIFRSNILIYSKYVLRNTYYAHVNTYLELLPRCAAARKNAPSLLFPTLSGPLCLSFSSLLPPSVPPCPLSDYLILSAPFLLSR